MFRLHKLILVSMSIFLIATFTACSAAGQQTAPTTTPVDIGSIKTAAVETAQMIMTLAAPTITPTFTITLPPSETPIGLEATNTPIGAIVESTLAITLTPSQTSLFGATAIPTFTPVTGSNPGGNPNDPVCKNAAYVDDLTIPDGTVFKPWEKFRKMWRLQNTGTCTWDEGFYFGAVSDNAPSIGRNQHPWRLRVPSDFIEPGETMDVAIDMFAPGDPGEYVAHWHMFDDDNKPFGSDFTVVIKVVK